MLCVKGRLMRKSAVLCFVTGILVYGHSAARAQIGNPPLEIWDSRGTWLLDQGTTQGLIVNRGTNRGLLDSIGFPAPRQLIVVVTTTAISITSDNTAPILFPFDGVERPVRDARTGAELDISHRFTFVAGMAALTTSQAIPGGDMTLEKSTIVTDALRVEGDTLIIERQHSVLAKDGRLMPLANQPRRSTLIYRRAPR